MSFSFGGSSATAAPAASGFSFGAAAPASAGFSFGGAAAPAASAPASGGFGFGAAPAAAAPAPATGGFGFGAAPAAAAPAPAATGGFGFGAPATTAPASTGFSFGSGGASATPAASGFGFGGLGAQQPTGFGFGSAAAAPAPQPVGSPITLETAFEALPPDVKRNMTQFHAFLKAQEQSEAFLKTVSPRQLEALRANMARLEQDALARRNRQDRQAAAVQHVRQDVRQLLHQVDAATLSRRSLESDSGGLYHVLRRVEMPSPYYWELLSHYEHKMAAVKAQIEDVEAEFKPLYDGRAGGASPAPAQLQQILRAQNAALMQAAARVAEVHEKAEEMRQLFLARMQADLARHGEKNPAAFQNPFDKRKRSSEGDKRQAIDKIRFRTSVAPTIVPPTAAAAAPAASAGFGFASAAPSAPTAATSSFFSFDAPSAPAKSVSFSLGGSSAASAAPVATSAAPVATSAPLAVAAVPGGGFSAPTVATGGFGSITSSFLPPAAADKKTAGSKRGGRAQKKRL